MCPSAPRVRCTRGLATAAAAKALLCAACCGAWSAFLELLAHWSAEPLRLLSLLVALTVFTYTVASFALLGSGLQLWPLAGQQRLAQEVEQAERFRSFAAQRDEELARVRTALRDAQAMYRHAAAGTASDLVAQREECDALRDELARREARSPAEEDHGLTLREVSDALKERLKALDACLQEDAAAGARSTLAQARESPSPRGVGASASAAAASRCQFPRTRSMGNC